MDDFLSAAARHIWWLLAALAGRMMFHSREALGGRRRFWGRELPFELVIAVAMGVIAFSLCSWLTLSGHTAAGVISAVAYLGPRALDTLFDRASRAGVSWFQKEGNGGDPL